jgi:DsbC/DsbD-like thiol-disulfide interchange protein
MKTVLMLLMTGWLVEAAMQAPKPVIWAVSAPVPRARVSAGGTVSVQVTATIDTGWHLYSTTQPPGGPVPTRITVVSPPAFALGGPMTFPKPTTRPDPNFGINVETYEHAVTFTLPVRVAPGTAAGVDTVTVKAHYQACNATLCLPPQTATLALPVTVAAR